MGRRPWGRDLKQNPEVGQVQEGWAGKRVPGGGSSPGRGRRELTAGHSKRGVITVILVIGSSGCTPLAFPPPLSLPLCFWVHLKITVGS